MKCVRVSFISYVLFLFIHLIIIQESQVRAGGTDSKVPNQVSSSDPNQCTFRIPAYLLSVSTEWRDYFSESEKQAGGVCFSVGCSAGIVGTAACIKGALWVGVCYLGVAIIPTGIVAYIIRKGLKKRQQALSDQVMSMDQISAENVTEILNNLDGKAPVSISADECEHWRSQLINENQADEIYQKNLKYFLRMLLQRKIIQLESGDLADETTSPLQIQQSHEQHSDIDTKTPASSGSDVRIEGFHLEEVVSGSGARSNDSHFIIYDPFQGQTDQKQGEGSLLPSESRIIIESKTPTVAEGDTPVGNGTNAQYHLMDVNLDDGEDEDWNHEDNGVNAGGAVHTGIITMLMPRSNSRHVGLHGNYRSF